MVGVRGFIMFCQRGSEFFIFLYLICVYVCVCVGGGVRISNSPSVNKITDPLLLKNDWSL